MAKATISGTCLQTVMALARLFMSVAGLWDGWPCGPCEMWIDSGDRGKRLRQEDSKLHKRNKNLHLGSSGVFEEGTERNTYDHLQHLKFFICLIACVGSLSFGTGFV